jgi:hypothetical protein
MNAFRILFLGLVRRFLLILTWWPTSRFEKALFNPEESQRRVLKKVLRHYHGSRYSVRFGKVRNLAEFRAKVPIITYDDIVDHQSGAFTKGMVLFHEKTSGSSGKKKEIPYTSALLSIFGRMFLYWAHDILRHIQKWQSGKFYFSISPLPDHQVGTSQRDDSDYLPWYLKPLLSPFFINPPLKNLKKSEDYLYALTLHLLAHRDLEVISLWSPSLMKKINDIIEEELPRLAIDLEKGQTTIDGHSFSYPKRNIVDIKIHGAFPSLKLLSTWGSAAAQNDFEELKHKFPKTLVQAKGLLATEAPLTLPWIRAQAFVPLLTDVFFEFVDEAGLIYSLSEIEIGKQYRLIFSAPGGYIRYDLGDLVIVTHLYHSTPCFDFIGRSGLVSDLVGEKLTEMGLQPLLQGLAVALIPDRIGMRYWAILDDSRDEVVLQQKLEEKLNETHHYRVARKLGQLKPVGIINIKDARRHLNDYLVEERKMKLGDIKEQCLYPREDDGQLLRFLQRHGGRLFRPD